ncbi:hypothetical protein BsWGS_16234 [Bradybaena similaris]
MADYDSEALYEANKGLSICCIIAITITNCILIYKQFRKGSLIYTPRSLVLTSLAIGDIFLALFALVFLARLLFETYFTYECSTYKAFQSYSYYLIHFVYGLGLAVLAGEFLQRHRTPQPTGNTSSSLVKSIVYSACPWILGLVIIIPLTMANTYGGRYSHDGCQFITPSRLKAMHAVSVILPAILAVLVCIAVMFVKLPYQSSSSAAVTYQGPTQGVVITSQNTNVGNAAAPQQYPGSNAAAAPYYHNTSIPGPQLYLSNGQTGSSQMQMASANDRPHHNPGGQIFSTPNAQYPVQQYPIQQYPVQQYPGQQYPPTQNPVQYPPPQFPAQQYTTQSNVVFTAPTNVVYQQNTTAPNPDKEKKALLVAAIVYFVCVVPHASYVVHYTSTADTDSSVVAENLLFWLSIARSLITPIIFILVN